MFFIPLRYGLFEEDFWLRKEGMGNRRGEREKLQVIKYIHLGIFVMITISSIINNEKHVILALVLNKIYAVARNLV